MILDSFDVPLAQGLERDLGTEVRPQLGHIRERVFERPGQDLFDGRAPGTAKRSAVGSRHPEVAEETCIEAEEEEDDQRLQPETEGLGVLLSVGHGGPPVAIGYRPSSPDSPRGGQERDQPIPHAYATLSVLHRGCRFTVALTAVAGSEPLEDVLKRLLRQAAVDGIRCRLLLLDRGSYSVGVIRYLQAARHPFLMPVICRDRKLDDPRGLSGTNVFLTWEKSGFGTYTLHDADQRPARVSICVKCRCYRGQWRRTTETESHYI
jgi:hypothetical protein